MKKGLGQKSIFRLAVPESEGRLYVARKCGEPFYANVVAIDQPSGRGRQTPQTRQASNEGWSQMPGGSRRTEWLRRIGLPESDLRQDVYVCGRHFKPEDYNHDFGLMQRLAGVTIRSRLNLEALPSLFLPDPKESVKKRVVKRVLQATSKTAAIRPAPWSCSVGGFTE
ncbi:hypothetical protein MTO96_007242 [Rhipicephalus appendiculatus]